MNSLILPMVMELLSNAEQAASMAAGFGTGADGAITDNFTAQLPSHNSNVAIIQASSINLPAGKVITTSHRAKGLIIYCQGDCTINGTISMTGKCAPVSGDQLKVYSYNNAIYTPPRGGKGGNGGNSGKGSDASSKTGGPGNTGGTAPSTGNLYGGGTPGGGADGGSSVLWDFVNGPANGNQGTIGASPSADTAYTSSLKAGTGGYACNYPSGQSGADPGILSAYPGGLLILIVRGNLTINSGGIVCANGDAGVNATPGANQISSTYGSGGGAGGSGGPGGGVIIFGYAGTYTNNGSVTVNAGAGGLGSSPGTGGTGQTAGTNGSPGTAGTIATVPLSG